jgi:hypothetical protein
MNLQLTLVRHITNGGNGCILICAAPCFLNLIFCTIIFQQKTRYVIPYRARPSRLRFPTTPVGCCAFDPGSFVVVQVQEVSQRIPMLLVKTSLPLQATMGRSVSVIWASLFAE